MASMTAGTIEIQLLSNIARLQSDMNKAQGVVAKSMKSIEASAKMAMSAIGGLVGALGIRELARVADEYTKLNAQLKLATRNANEYAQAYSNVQRIARSAQVDLSATAQLYARLSNALRDAGASQRQISDISETVSLALRVNGATAAETTSAMLQLAQAFGSGRLAGEEFRAVSEAAPPLLRELAKALGVTYGELKELAKEGKITADVMAKAWTNPEYLAGLREQVKEVQTLGSAVTVLKNNFTTIIGKMNEASGTGTAFGNAILAVADNLGFFADVVFGAFEVVRQFGRSLAVVFNDIKTFGEVAGMSANIFTMALNKDKIAEALRQRQEFTKAANEDLDKFVNGNFRRFREAMSQSREEAAKPYDDQPIKAFGKAIDEVATKAEKFKKTELDKWFDDENRRIVDQIEARAKAEADAAEEARKQMEKDEKERADLIMRRNKEISDEYLRGVKEQNDKAQREYEQFYDRLSQSISDALFRGFESGKDFIQNFKDTLIRAFQTLVLQPQIDMIVRGSGIGALFGAPGVASAGGLVESATSSGGLGGIFSAGKSIFQGITQGFSSLNSTIIGSIEGLSGDLISNGFDKLGGFLFENSSLVANGLSLLPAAFSLLKGDIKGAAFQGAGAGIGMAIGGPVGGAIGSFLGGAVGGLFGGEDIPLVGSNADGVFRGGKFSRGITGQMGDKDLGASSSLEALSETFATRLGTLLKTFGKNDQVFAGAAFRSRTNVRGFFNSVFDGGSVNLTKKYGKDMQASFQQYADEIMGPLFVEAVQKSKLPDSIKAMFDGMAEEPQISRMLQAVLKLKDSSEQLKDVYEIGALKASRVAKASGYAGDALIKLTNQLANAANSYKTLGDVLVPVYEKLDRRLGRRGIDEVPESVKAFDELLKAIDTTNPDGIRQFAELFKLRKEFKNFDKVIDQLQGGVRGSLFGMVSPQEQQAMMQEDLAKLFGDLNLEVPGSIEELINLGKSIDYTTKAGINLAAAFPSLVQAFNQAQSATNGLIDSLKELNPDNFSSLFAFTRAQAYVNNGISLDRLPSYDVGTPFVPQTGPAMIHKGERILTASENRSFGAGNSELISEVRMLRQDNQNMRRELQAIAISSSDTARSVDRLQRDGFLIRDVDRNGDPTVLQVEVVA